MQKAEQRLKTRFPTLVNLLISNWFLEHHLCLKNWHVAIDSQDIQKAAFFRYIVCHLAYTMQPATFVRLMETVLPGLQLKLCLIYMDDNLCKEFQKYG